MRDNKIAILVHIYFVDVFVDQMLPKLKLLDDIGDFYFNIVRGQETDELLNTIKINFKHHTISFTEKNVGRDINGQLNNLKALYDQNKYYDYYLFVHTKKSQHLDKNFGKNWLDNLLYHTIGDELRITNILKRFKNEPKLGMIGAPNCKVNLMTVNGHNVNELAKIFKINKHTKFWYIAGTMFWVRASIIDQYFDVDGGLIEWLQEQFTEENGAIDGQIHHAFERIFGLMVYANGYYLNEKR